MRNVIFSFCILFISSCIRFNQQELVKEVGIEGTENIKAQKIAFRQLLSEPGKWVTDTLELSGYLSYNFEDVALYKSKVDYDEGLKHNSVWIDFDKRLRGQINLEDYAGKEIILKGIFSPGKGHLMQYSGTLEEIYYLSLADQ